MPARSVDFPFFFGISMYAWRCCRVPSDFSRPKISPRTYFCHGNSRNGCPAVWPLECFSTFSKNP